MVGSVTRWEPGVGGDQQHLAVTDHVAGLDPPIIPLSLPTLPRPLPSHAHTPRPAEDLDGSVEETPCLEEHRRGRERTTSPRHAPSQPPASARPESLPGLDANGRQHNHHRAPAPTTSSAHEAHPGSATHTSTNGTRRRPPPVLPPALATPDAWAEPEETAPLTPATNGEVARRGLNGVVVKKMARGGGGDGGGGGGGGGSAPGRGGGGGGGGAQVRTWPLLHARVAAKVREQTDVLVCVLFNFSVTRNVLYVCG
ncbi:translation initiation factor IF-2-like [Penaeus monodon]|uniref:translation initiation factor IF-2-like n=1 Tax=Penaeus monodon TaxID=6687 RepID=UPI0018A7D935|nr:translation initiation factor IF-2-like [Penaeus monodon]XP_037775367.1 translation initiation factor IF-2-like [Penaeus monodon]XP_037775368.1 translation initiation factor IF-2-like [Penaeus monodon]